jgi:hypothetical protein
MPTEADLKRDHANMVKLLSCPPYASYNWLSTFIDKARVLELHTEIGLKIPSTLVRNGGDSGDGDSDVEIISASLSRLVSKGSDSDDSDVELVSAS